MVGSTEKRLVDDLIATHARAREAVAELVLMHVGNPAFEAELQRCDHLVAESEAAAKRLQEFVDREIAPRN